MQLRDYGYILNDPAVERLFRYKAETSKREYLSVIRRFLDFAGPELAVKDPSSLVVWAKSRPDNLEVQDIIEKFGETQSETSKTVCMYIVRSLLKRNGATLPSMGGARQIMKNWHRGYERAELQSLIGYLDRPFQKLYVLVAKDSGLRAQDILSLRYRHVQKDLEAGEKFVHLRLEPSFYNRKKASGLTFVGPDAVKLLRQLIDEGWTHNVIRTLPGKKGEKARKATKTITEKISKDPDAKLFNMSYAAMGESLMLARNKAGLDPLLQPSHGARKFFESCLDRTGMDVHLKLRIEGHASGSRDHYTTRDIEGLRNEYEKAYPFLDLSEQAVIDKSVLDLKTTLENQARTITEQTEQIKTLKAEMSKQHDLKGEIDSLRRDFAVLDDVRRRTPGVEDEFEKLDRLRKQYEEKIRTFHKLTKYIAQRASSSRKK